MEPTQESHTETGVPKDIISEIKELSAESKQDRRGVWVALIVLGIIGGASFLGYWKWKSDHTPKPVPEVSNVPVRVYTSATTSAEDMVELFKVREVAKAAAMRRKAGVTDADILGKEARASTTSTTTKKGVVGH